MNEEQAKIIGLQSLSYLVGNPSALERFFALSGVNADDLRRRADDPAMLAGILDFFLGNEAQLLEMCRATDMAGEAPALARRRLMGGQNDEWS